MSVAYGVDANGRPISGDGAGEPCQSGWTKDASGECKKQASGPVPTNTGINGPSVTKTTTYTPQDRDRIVTGWEATGGKTTADIDAYLASSAPGWTRLDDDKVQDPNKRTFDWIGDYGTPQAQARSGYTTDKAYASVTGSGTKKAATPSKSGGSALSTAASAAKAVVPPAYTPQNPVQAYQFQQTPFAPTQPLKPFEFLADYNPTEYAGSAYDLSGTRDQTTALINKMLSETSLNPGVVAQVKEAQKGTIVDGAEQLRQRSLQDASRRGVSSASSLGRIDSDMLGEISKAYRDIDISKATQDRTDQLNAAGASQGWQESLVDQFLALEDPKFRGYQADRDREVSNAGEQARVQNSDFERWLAQEGLNLSTQGAQAGENARVQSQEFSQWATRQGINLDQMRLQQDESQFARNLQLLIAKFLSGE